MIDTRVGYCGGDTENPTYEQVCAAKTGHAEAVEVIFETKEIAYARLLEVFFSNHDPTTPDRQGPNVGSQYRSVVLVHDAQQEQAARAAIEALDKSGKFSNPVITAVIPATEFWPAEDYHQRHLEKQGVVPTCNL